MASKKTSKAGKGKKASPASKKIVFGFQKARSKAAKKGWRKQWSESKRIGKKGRQFIRAVERKQRIDEIREAREAPGGEERLLDSGEATVVEDPVIRTGRKKK